MEGRKDERREKKEVGKESASTFGHISVQPAVFSDVSVLPRLSVVRADNDGTSTLGASP